jgi:alcohol dehydrogenase (cytochrome c)
MTRSARRNEGKPEDIMSNRNQSLLATLLAGSVLAASPVLAAEVTPQRLLNPDKEPQNWLMNHRSYDGQRFSPLARINKANVKGLKFAYAVALAGTHGGEFIEATPLAEDGFLYITDSWSVLYKIDASAGNVGRIVWRMDPKQERTVANRGAALWGDLVISPASAPARIIATDKSSGNVVWESNVSDSDRVTITGAPLAIKDKIVIGASGGDGGARDWVAALDAATGKLLWRKYTIPAPGEPGSETWKDKNNAWQTGGGAVWVTGTYDPDTNQTLWGVGNPVPMMDARARPGDNLFTNSVISWDPDNGKMNWYFQYTPGDMWDYDEVGTHGRRQALRGQRQLDGRHRPEDRQAGRLRSQQGRADLFGPRRSDLGQSDQEGLSQSHRRQQLLPVRLQSPDPAALYSRHHGLRTGDQRQDHRGQAG